MYHTHEVGGSSPSGPTLNGKIGGIRRAPVFFIWGKAKNNELSDTAFVFLLPFLYKYAIFSQNKVEKLFHDCFTENRYRC
jgi:hypothetical protein